MARHTDQEATVSIERAQLTLHPESELVPRMGRDERTALRADIEERGLLVALEITAAGIVLDGRERLSIAAELGIERLAVQIVAPEDEREHMLRAVLLRRQLTASQRAALTIELEAVRGRKAEASERQRANLRQETEVATLPPRGERTRELAARIAGVSPRIVQDAQTVREADPDLFEAIKQGRLPAHTAARRVRRARRDAELGQAPPLPEGPFELVYADPPWQLGNPDGAHAPENHYPTLPLGEIAALAVPVADAAVLFLWVPNCLLPEGIEVLQSWGFAYRGNLVWVKPSIGLGNWARNRHELLLVGNRGSFPCPEREDRPDSVIEAPRGRHSEKPACVYELLERAYPEASKLELFARGKPRAGWAVWGNELEG